MSLRGVYYLPFNLDDPVPSHPAPARHGRDRGVQESAGADQRAAEVEPRRGQPRLLLGLHAQPPLSHLPPGGRPPTRRCRLPRDVPLPTRHPRPPAAAAQPRIHRHPLPLRREVCGDRHGDSNQVRVRKIILLIYETITLMAI